LYLLKEEIIVDEIDITDDNLEVAYENKEIQIHHDTNENNQKYIRKEGNSKKSKEKEKENNFD
jgi:hypothetical protein